MFCFEENWLWQAKQTNNPSERESILNRGIILETYHVKITSQMQNIYGFNTVAADNTFVVSVFRLHTGVRRHRQLISTGKPMSSICLIGPTSYNMR
jgi:hypothetical protein